MFGARYESWKKDTVEGESRCIISSGWLLWKAMQMLFNPSVSHPLKKKKKKPLLQSITLHVSLIFSTAVHLNKTWSLHYTFECCADDWNRADKSPFVHSAELIEQKVMRVIILSLYKRWDLYFQIMSCSVEPGKSRKKTILPCSMNIIFAICSYWKCSVVLVRWQTVDHTVVCHCSSICLYTTSQQLEKPQNSPVSNPAMLNWPKPVPQRVSGLQSVCSYVLSAVQPICPQSCFFLRYKVIEWSRVNGSYAH